MLLEVTTNYFARHRKSFSPHQLFEIISAGDVEDVLTTLGLSFRQRIFTPTVTLFAFLSQILSPDGSCRRAVIEVIALRLRLGQKSCCLNSGSLSKAKGRLPLALIKFLVARLAAASPCSKETTSGLPLVGWRHGDVKVIDGTGVSAPDTPVNRRAFPHHSRNPVSFPVIRVVALFALSTGKVIDLVTGPWKGKGSGEHTLFFKLVDHLKAGDTLLGDSVFSSYVILASAQQRGFHVVSELTRSRLGRLKRGRVDQLVTLEKPKKKPSTLSDEDFAALPEQIRVRVIKVTCAPKGFRPKIKYIVTTHVDQDVVTPEDIADLYRQRWAAELNFRSLKTTLGMDILVSQTPTMLEKEIWTYMLGYNMIRVAMEAAAATKQIPSTLLSFRATQQLLDALRQQPAIGSDLLDLIATQRVGTRPDRYEPRAIKRRKKNFALLSTSRAVAKRRLHKKYKRSKA